MKGSIIKLVNILRNTGEEQTKEGYIFVRMSSPRTLGDDLQ